MDTRTMTALRAPFTDDHNNPVRLDARTDGGVELTAIAPERDEWVGMGVGEVERLRELLERYLEWLAGKGDADA